MLESFMKPYHLKEEEVITRFPYVIFFRETRERQRRGYNILFI